MVVDAQNMGAGCNTVPDLEFVTSCYGAIRTVYNVTTIRNDSLPDNRGYSLATNIPIEVEIEGEPPSQAIDPEYWSFAARFDHTYSDCEWRFEERVLLGESRRKYFYQSYVIFRSYACKWYRRC